MIGRQPTRGGGEDDLMAAFGPLNAINQSMMGSLGVLDALQTTAMRPQMQQQQSIDSLLRFAGDLLPPGVLEQLLASRMPGVGMPTAQANPGLPPGIDPAQLQMMQEILMQQ